MARKKAVKRSRRDPDPGSVRALLSRGAGILCPESVWIDPAVDPARISSDVVIHPGCRISGSETSVGRSCVLGREGPLTVENCQLADNVKLNGGFVSDATLLSGVEIGSSCHVRPGTLLEEQVSCAHAVGLKQTILLPFVTLGSLINLCDCLMAGGSDRRNHSEVGSSYVHFNFTPHQDKATASLIGDVPRGVMLDQPPVFLGGQGGLVGPTRIEFGTIIGAGTVCRRDVLSGNRLVFDLWTDKPLERPYTTGLYTNIERVLRNNFIFVGNLHALYCWYRTVRVRFADRSQTDRAAYEGALKRIESALDERVKRLGELAAKMPRSLALARNGGHMQISRQAWELKEQFNARWPEIHTALQLNRSENTAPDKKEAFLLEFEKVVPASAYIDTIRKLPPPARSAGTDWLQAVVDAIAGIWRNRVDRNSAQSTSGRRKSRP